MFVNYIKSKNISKRGKVIALSVVGGIFVLLIFTAIWHRNFADTHKKYMPNNTEFYAHFSRPKIKSSEYTDKIIMNLISDLGIDNYSDLNISREFSIVGQIIDDKVLYSYVLSTDRPAKTKQILDDSGLSYKFLSTTVVVISSDENVLYLFEKNKDNLLSKKIKRQFLPFNTLSIYGSNDFVSLYGNDLLLGFLYKSVVNENGDMFLNFKTKNQGINLVVSGISKATKKLNLFETTDPEVAIDGDIVIDTTNFSYLLNNWESILRLVSVNDYDLFFDTVLGRYIHSNSNAVSNISKAFLVASKNNNQSNWVMSDYDFVIKMYDVREDLVVDVLKTVMAYHYPTYKSIYLSDGTRVKELQPNIDDFEFVEKNGVNSIYSPDQEFRLMYEVGDGFIKISNSEDLLVVDYIDSESNYMSIDSSIIPDDGIGYFLGMFETISIGSDGLIIK